jgi:hypothetical protein
MGNRASLVEALQAGGVMPLPRSNAGQFDVERRLLGAPWVPVRAAEASTPWRERMDTGPIGRLVHPRLYFRNCAFSLALSCNDDRSRD